MPGAKIGGFLPKPVYQPAAIGFAVARPKKKLKAFHWEKVDSPEVTVWASVAPSHEAKEEKYAELSRKGILDEIEKLFTAKEIKELGKKSDKKKQERKQILGSSLFYIFQIAMATFNAVEPETLARMIIHCDKAVIENNVVMEFLQSSEVCNVTDYTAKQFAPYSRDWTGPDALNTPREQDPAELTREDQVFLYTAFELRHYWNARMRALRLTRTFESDYDEMSAKLKQVVDVSESLRNSVRLMPVFGLILDIGNYMNDVNKQAVGFRLASLARLGMVKDDKNEMTLMDYIERVVRKQYPQYEGFAEDIAGVTAASRINVDQLENDATAYINNIRIVQASLDSGSLSDPRKFHPEERASQVAQRSMKDARRKAEQMQLYLDDMKKTYNDILTFFGDDNTTKEARDNFFTKLSNFISEYRKSREKNMAVEKTQRRNEASMRRKAGNVKTGSIEDGPDVPPSPNPNTGAMDSLLEKLRAAAPSTKDSRDRRRRNRLNDRHQRRVASGQTMPDLSIQPPSSPLSASQTGSDLNDLSPGNTPTDGASEGEDVAERAANLLQGLRGDDGPEEQLRVRRRRENADTERARRRERRRANKDSVDGSGTATPRSPLGVDDDPDDGAKADARRDKDGQLVDDDDDDDDAVTSPITVVVPPSPPETSRDRSRDRSGSPN